MNNGNTGLGESLLLRRTDETQASQPAANVETPRRSPSPQPQSQPKVSRPAPKLRPLRDRCTIYLDPDINRRLDLVARIERKERSEVVSDLLREHLPHYEIRRDDESAT